VPIRFACPSCGAVTSAPEDKGGGLAYCPICWDQVRVPAIGKLIGSTPAAETSVPTHAPPTFTLPPLPARTEQSPPPEPARPVSPPKSDFISLGCPSCGGNLQITTDADRFACKYCAREHLVRRENGVITVTPILEKLERIISASDRHASELAIPRLRQDCRAIEDRIADERDYIEDWERWRDEQSGHPLIWFIFVLPICLGAVICLGMAAHWSLTVVGVLLLAGLSVLFVNGRVRRKSRVAAKVTRAEERIEDLEHRLREKRRELRKHYDNVRI
jgi:hypothetical protein